METSAVLLAIYLALWIGLYKNDIKKDLGIDKPAEQTQQVEETK
jgi:hypothetical protein